MLEFVKSVNNILWGYLLIFLLCGTGIFFTFRLKGIQIRKFGEGFRRLFGGISLKGEKADKDGMSSFQAVATAIAAQVGTGNLAGAATAIVLGGPGAIFWMWLAAFFGMATIYAEAVLAQKFKETSDDGQVVGGPAYYIKKGLKSNFLAGFFSISIIIALGFIGNMVQSNSIADAFNTAYNIPTYVTGIVIAFIAGLIFIGGIGRIASFTEKIVPIMAVIYIIGGGFVIIANIGQLIPAFKMIFQGAFNPAAATGGLIGVGVKEAMRYGIARGLFSNEAGMGSTPHAHAVAKVKKPSHQGYVAIVSVFIDTFIILNITAFVILVTGCIDATGVELRGIALTQLAFGRAFGTSFGNTFIAICLFFFAFSTIIGWYYFAESNVRYLFGSKSLLIFRLLAVVCIFLGSAIKVELVWELADTFNGIMVIPNLIGLLGLSALVAKVFKEDNSDVVKVKTKSVNK